MTILYKGIRRKTTDVLDDYGQARHMVNVRLKRMGEMGRRAGLGKSNMAQLAGPVQFMIGSWGSEPYIINGTGGDVTGNDDPLALWTAATLRIPDGLVGEPAAPTILSITPTPASGAAYPVGLVQFLAVIQYDGLSGVLSYLWGNYTIGPGTPTQVIIDSNPGVLDFNGGCTPSVYSAPGNGLTISTQFNGFSDFMEYPDYTVS